MRTLIVKKKAPGLMLTPLLDMFTIILIFLIVSFSNEDQDFKLAEGLKLPESRSLTIFKPSINLWVSKEGVTVEGVLVAPLTDGEATEEEYAAGEIPALVESLGKYWEALNPEAAAREAAGLEGEGEDEGEGDEGGGGDGGEAGAASEEIAITIQADRGLDYRTLHLVMKSAAKAGFFKYRLAVLRK